MAKRRTSRHRNAWRSLFASLLGEVRSDFTTLDTSYKPRIEHLEQRHLLAVTAELSIPDDLTGLLGGTVTVPIQLNVKSLSGILFTGGEAALTYDSSKFTVNGVPRIGSTFSTAEFSSEFNSNTPGVVKFTTSKATGVHLDFTDDAELVPYDLFLVDLTVTSGLGSTSIVDLDASHTGLTTEIFESGNQPITLNPAPTNADTDDVDGLISILNITISTTGPYSVAEGSTVSLSGTASDSINGITSFEWDLDNDGIFGETGAAASRGNETGLTPTFSAVGQNGPATPSARTVKFRVFNGIDQSGVANTTVNIHNVPPTANAGGPYTVTEGGVVALSGSGTDPVDNLVQAFFLWNLDGDETFGETTAETATRGIETSRTPTFNAFGLTAGTSFDITLLVTDTATSTFSTTSVVVVSDNQAPVANAGGPYNVDEGSSVTLSASGSTDDSTPVGSMTYNWDLDGDGSFGETGGDASRGNETGLLPTYNAAGVNGPSTATVAVRAIDSQGVTSTNTATALITVANVAPTAFPGGAYSITEGSSTGLNGTGNDPVDSVTFLWDLDGDTTFGETGAAASQGSEVGADVTFNAAGLSAPATLTVTLQTQDGDGGSTTSTTTVTISNSLPETDAGGPYIVAEGNSTTLNGIGFDAGGSVTLTWDLDGDGTFGESGPAASRGNEVGATPIYNAAGVSGPASITVTIRATDNGGTSVTDTALISITNVIPTASAGGPYTVVEGGVVSLSGSGSDPVDNLTYTWDLDRDGTRGETGATATHGNETGPSPLYNASGISGPQDATVQLRVTDANGASSISTALIVVTNVAPSGATGGSYNVAEGVGVGISGTGVDVTDAVSLTWDLDGDGTFGETGAGASRGNEVAPTTPFFTAAPNGVTSANLFLDDIQYTFTWNSVDGHYTMSPGDQFVVQQAGQWVYVDVLEDEYPMGLPTSHHPFYKGAAFWDAAWPAKGWDLEFGAGFVDGRPVEASSVVFSAVGLSGPHTSTISFRVTDANGASTTATTTVVVTNVAPTAIAGGPYHAAEGGTVGLTGTGTDPVDSVTFAWDLDGDTTFGETGAAASQGSEVGADVTFNAAGLSAPATLTVTLQTQDGDGGSTTSTTTVTISNSLPETDAGGPYTVSEGNSTTLNGIGFDAGGSVTLMWDLDGNGTFGESGPAASRGNETGNSPSFNAAGLSGPATMTVTLRVTDMSASSTLDTATVTVTNVAPSASAGGAYSIAEGGTVTLSGTGTDPVDTVSLEWDLDGDGSYGEVGGAASRGNETGANPVFNSANLNGLTTFRVSLRVTDSDGAVVINALAPSAWQNPLHPYDVNQDNFISAIDYLLLIAAYPGLTGSPLPPISTGYFDVDGDSWLTENDKFLLSNFLIDNGSVPVDDGFVLPPAGPTFGYIVVHNAAPTANAGGPYAVVEGGATVLSGSGTDPADGVTLVWDLDGDGSFGETGGGALRGVETGVTPTFNAVSLSGPATVTLTVRAIDDDGASANATTTVAISNAPPSATSGGPYNVAEGGSTTLSGTGTDPVDTVTLHWDLDGNGTFGETGGAAARGNETGASPSFFATGLNGPTTATVTLRVTDADGASSTSTAEIEVTNLPPDAEANGPYTVTEGSATGLTGTGTDPLDSVVLTWDLDGNGTFGETGGAAARGNETGNNPSFNAAGINGPTTVLVTIKVSDGFSNPTDTALIVVNNAPPTANAGGPYILAEGLSTTLHGVGTDPVDAVKLTWDLDGDSTFGETGSSASRGDETGSNPTFSASDLSGPATRTITLRATDCDMAVTTATTTVVVTNEIPTANAGGPYSVAEGGIVALSGTGTDPVDAVTLLWDLDGDGTFGETGAGANRGIETGATPSYNAAGIPGPASIPVTLRVVDSNGASATDFATIGIANLPPTAEAGGPYTVAEGGTRQLSGTGADSAGSVELVWDLDGDGTFGDTGGLAGRGNETGVSPIFSPTGLNGPTSILVTVCAIDSSGASTTDTATIVILNSPPTASAGGPYSVAEGGSTTLNGSGTDLSGEVTLDWDLDGDGTFGETGGAAARGDETGNSPSYSAVGLDGPTTSTVTVRTADNDGDSTMATVLVNVSNVAPMVDAGGPYAVAAGGSVALTGVGGPTFSDPGQPDTHTAIWDLDGDGVFGETGVAAGRGNETGLTPTFVANNAFGQVVITLRVTDDDGGTANDTAIVTVAGAQFDFNHDTTPLGPVGTPTPTQAGYSSVLTRDTYTAAKGFGWNVFTSSFDRNAINTTSLPDMRRDGHYGTRNLANTANPTGARTFRADLPNGMYTVNVTMGDSLFSHDNMQIRAEVGEVNQKVLPLISNPAGQFVHTSFTIQVADGHLDLEFSDQGGGNMDWVLNGIEIRPTGIDTIVFATPGNIVTDGVTPTTFTATTALAENTLVTITTNVGTIVTPDADPVQPSWVGNQVKVIGGQITFAVVSTSTTPVIVRAVSVDGLAEGTTTANTSLPDLRRYDFNATVPAGGNLITAPGYASVTAGNVYSSAAGFGWLNNSGIGEFQRNGGAANSTPLRRDAHYGSGAAGHTFQIVVTQGVQYNVRVYVGDYGFSRSNIAVTVEGATPYIIPPLAAGAFDFRMTTAPITASANGLLTVNIRNTTGAVWVANGIDIWKVGTSDPGAAMLQAADIAVDGNTGATLSSADLAPIVSEAITRWAATGLSPAQVAALQATQIQIVDLGNAKELGNALPGVVQIDDDAAGHGWYIDLTPSDDDEFDLSIAAAELQATRGTAAGQMDLLTLVMHELGHELGLEDLADASDPHNLMTENISTGVRRTPGANQAAGAVPPLFTTPTSARDEVFASLSGLAAPSIKSQPAPTSNAASVLTGFVTSNRVSRPSARQKLAVELPK